MKFKQLFLILLSLLLLSCSRSGLIERKIGEQIDNCKQDVPCLIKIRELTNFKWDKMYVFSPGVSLDQIQKTIGTTFPHYVEFKRRIVFINDGGITHSEDEPTNLEGMTDGQVLFDGMETEPSYLSLTPDNAVFTAIKYKTGYGIAYSLKQVK